MEESSEHRKRLLSARRIVVKLGTSVVTAPDGTLRDLDLEPLLRSISRLKSEGRQIVLVSSGAVGLGAGRLGLSRARLSDIVMRQACAAIGQSLLMHAYERLFSALEINIAQVLLTEDDFTHRRRYSAVHQTMEKLLKLGVLPIVNENDTVSTAELEYINSGAARIFSDNDRLAALVMSKLEADALVLLTDVDGLLDRQGSDSQKVIPMVDRITPELKALATGPSAAGRGGMSTKLEAAEIAMRAGGVAVIANGRKPETLDHLFAGREIGTVFLSRSRMTGKKRWIQFAAGVHGRVIVNEGARAALTTTKASLLSSGIVRVENSFGPLEVVSIVDPDGREFARGITNLGSSDATEMIKKKHEKTRAKNRVVVTRDNIVLLET